MNKLIRKTIILCSLSIFVFIPVRAQQKPNIILILADDMGYGQLGCYGQKMTPTPHIDSLASAGTRFTAYYAGSSVCAPSRECLLTGYHTGHTAIRGNFRLDVDVGNLPMAKGHRTIAEYLQHAGYRTAMFGKWGVGGPETGPNARGFDYSFCYIDQAKAHNYYPSYLWENNKKVELSLNKDGKKKVYSHHLFVNKTLEYIRESENDQPFFLYLAYTLPHGSYTLPPDTPYTKKDWPEHFQVYATMVSLLDRSVGRIVELLKHKGIADNTIIFFTSDNGANAGPAQFFKANGVFRGAKRELYEGGIREPLIVYWPGVVIPGQVSHHITAAWDFLPTICEVAGINPSPKIDGISFLPTLVGRKQKDHLFLYWEYYQYNYNWNKPSNALPRNYLTARAVRYGKWKAVKNHIYTNKNAKIELYDLYSDSSEEHNVANDYPKMIDKIKMLFKNQSKLDPPYFPYTGEN